MNSEHFLQDSITFVSKSRNTNTISHLWTCWQIQTSNTYLLICQTFLTFLDSGFAIKGADFSGESVEVVEAAVVAVGGSA